MAVVAGAILVEAPASVVFALAALVNVGITIPRPAQSGLPSVVPGGGAT
jgi:hypothetical protein